MKAKTKKLPKGRVLPAYVTHGNSTEGWVSALPTRTKAEAAALVKWHNLSYGEKVIHLAETLKNPVKVGIFTYAFRDDKTVQAFARSALDAMGVKEGG
jgi:hypothetical protein